MYYGRLVVGCDFKAVPRGDEEITSSYQMKTLPHSPKEYGKELTLDPTANMLVISSGQDANGELNWKRQYGGCDWIE